MVIQQYGVMSIEEYDSVCDKYEKVKAEVQMNPTYPKNTEEIPTVFFETIKKLNNDSLNRDLGDQDNHPGFSGGSSLSAGRLYKFLGIENVGHI